MRKSSLKFYFVPADEITEGMSEMNNIEITPELLNSILEGLNNVIEGQNKSIDDLQRVNENLIEEIMELTGRA